MRLEVEIAGKRFENAAGERHDVIAGIAFALDAGEVGVFVGPSGCGKSTMLRILASGRCKNRLRLPGTAAIALAIGRGECAACRAAGR